MRWAPMVGLPGLRIVGVGCASEHGGRRVHNDEVDAIVEANGGAPADRAWLDRVGVASRWWTATPGGTGFDGAPRTEDLLADATAAALDRAGIAASEVDVFVAATTTPSRLTSSMATVAGGRLGIEAMALEVRAGCPSALHGLAVAAAQLSVGARVAVVAAAETLSRVAPGTGPLAYLAADAGAAVVLVRDEAATGSGVLGGGFGSDGTLADRAGAAAPLPPTAELVAADGYRLGFGEGYDDRARDVWRRVGPRTVEGTGVAADDIDAVIANQAGRARLADAATAAGQRAITVDLMATVANAGSASFLLAMAEAWEHWDRVDPGRVSPPTWLAVSVGGGLSYGGLVMRP